MRIIIKSGIYGIALTIVLASSSILRAQEPETNKPNQAMALRAPVPAQIFTAKRVFISNAGGVSVRDAFSGGPDRCYNEFYAALKSGGRYDVVSAPADADLVFEVSFTIPLMGTSVMGGGNGNMVTSISSYDPQFKLVILDSKTHFVLWTLTEHVQVSNLQASRDRNFDRAMAILVDNLGNLATRATATSDGDKKQVVK